jgi:hypothetical protein
MGGLAFVRRLVAPNARMLRNLPAAFTSPLGMHEGARTPVIMTPPSIYTEDIHSRIHTHIHTHS